MGHGVGRWGGERKDGSTPPADRAAADVLHEYGERGLSALRPEVPHNVLVPQRAHGLDLLLQALKGFVVHKLKRHLLHCHDLPAAEGGRGRRGVNRGASLGWGSTTHVPTSSASYTLPY